MSAQEKAKIEEIDITSKKSLEEHGILAKHGGLERKDPDGTTKSAEVFLNLFYQAVKNTGQDSIKK